MLRWLARLASVVFLFAVAEGAPIPGKAAPSPATTHAWERIDYPPVPIPGMEKEMMWVGVRSLLGEAGGGEGSQLCFDLFWSGMMNKDGKLDGPVPAVMTDPTKSKGRLHLSDGTIIQPKKHDEFPFGIGGGGGISYSRSYRFPWQRNVLEEAWFELEISGQTYWFELPYGLARNPEDPLLPETRKGEPSFPPTMKALGEKDRLVPWLRVIYNLGEIQNGWRLSYRVVNSAIAQSCITLYRDDRRGADLYLWNTETPRTSVELRLPGDVPLLAKFTDTRLHQDGLRRSDSFTWDRQAEKERMWGKVIIKIDDKVYECMVPSSVFKQFHGVTDPANPKRIAGPDEHPDR